MMCERFGSWVTYGDTRCLKSSQKPPCVRRAVGGGDDDVGKLHYHNRSCPTSVLFRLIIIIMNRY
jgi:hypothetical protein